MQSYRWTKVWAVQTDMEDDVAVGETVVVESNGGDSKQVVLSVTQMFNKSGKPYKTLLLRELKD
jgi:hypothetical protein